MGKAYVDRALAANQDEIGKPIQDFITEHGWGAVWGREGLDRKTRSILNLAMLSILNRQHELRGHVRGAITNGVTKDEIREIFLHIGLYAGAPVMLELGADREGSDRRDGEVAPLSFRGAAKRRARNRIATTASASLGRRFSL